MQTKACSRCGLVYSLDRSNFGQKKETKKDGTSTIRFRSECRRCMSARTKAYDAANPSAAKARVDRRAARVDAHLPMPRDLPQVRVALSDRCRFCGKPLAGKGHVDHLTPVARGGTNRLPNLTLCCPECNLAKTSKTLEEFRTWRSERGLTNRVIRVPSEQPDPPSHNRLRERFS